MEQISGKESVGGNTFGIEPSKQDLRREASPLRSIATHGPPKNSPAHQKSASTATYTSPNKPFSQQTALYKKAVSVSNPGRQDAPSTTPAGTPPKRLHHDGPLNASKSKLQSIMKSARGLFTSTAGVSAQAKMETLSPGIAPLRSQDWQNKGHSIQNPDLGPASLNQMMYPGLPNGSQISISGEPGKAEGRKTRSNRERKKPKIGNGRSCGKTLRSPPITRRMQPPRRPLLKSRKTKPLKYYPMKHQSRCAKVQGDSPPGTRRRYQWR